MASFLTDLVKPYVEKLVNGAIAESSYICCFTCIAKDFEEEKARLEKERATFERRIEEATRRGEDVLPDALALKDEVDQLIQEDTKEEQKCFFEVCPHCLWRHSRGKLLAKKTERIKILMETGKELTIGVPAHLPDIERCTTQHYVHLKSRESQYKKLLVELKDDNNYIIGLQGMGGTGKTTLVEKVGKELKQSKQFTHVIITTVSFSPNIKKIQDDIAGPLGLKFDDCNDTDRPGKLWNRLTNGEKILLILDDMWGDVNFNEIGIPCGDNHKGCRIIVTTRNLSVCKKLGCNKTIQLDLLSKEDAWIMFKKYADLSETSAKCFLDKGRKIASECKNLPIAITVIASSLKGKQHQEEWDLALKFLKKDISRHNDDDDFLEIYECFKFSFDKLNEEAKSLFLLCSVFREDEVIDTESLATLAIGGGLFGEDYASYEEARSRVVKSKNKLLDSCLMLEADQTSVKMHDFARDAAQWIANKEIQTRKVYDKNQKAMLEREKNIKYLLCEGNLKEVFSCKFDGSKLEILIVINDMVPDYDDREIEVPDSFFENNTSLRVFHFHSNFPWLVKSLPQSMQQLKNIRSLKFSGCKLGDISIFGNLQSLEELDLYFCQINEMPNGIAELEKFRLLKLRHCSIGGNNPFEVIKRCSSLQELYFVFNFDPFHGEITFPKLQRFHVSHRDIDSSVSKCVCTEDMQEAFLSSTTLNYCMQEAEVLRLGRIKGEWRNIIPDIVHMDHGMNDLVELGLHNISQLKCLIDTTKHTYSQVSNVFSKLVVLKLKHMENLEELCNGSLSNDSFKSLESLSIENCKHLGSLSRIAHQCNLKSVSLIGCPMLTSLHERKGEGSEREILDSSSSNPMFMKLKNLHIMGCPKFEKILPLISVHDLPALESISVGSCDKLKYIFCQGVELGSLKAIELADVPDLIDIFPECNGTMSFSINRSSPISISASEPTTHPKPIKCSISSWTDMYCCGKKYENKLRSTTSTKIPLIYENQPQTNLMELNSNCLSINIWERAQCLSRQSKILCNVKKIELIHVRKIKSVFVLSIAPKMLLEVLIIRRCDKLKHIIVDTGDHDSMGGNNFGDVFPNLKELIVDGCVELEYIFGHYTNDHRNHAENDLLASLEYLHLTNLPSLVSICPKQYHITMPLLKIFELRDFLYANIKSIGDFIPHHSISRSGNCTTMKELGGSMEDSLALKEFKLINSKVENIFCVNEVNEQQVNLGLQDIKLQNLDVMVCPFVGPKNYFALLNLTKIQIMQCKELQIIFSSSILRCLPQLDELIITECEELKHIFQDDSENQNMSNSSSSTTCLPKLRILYVEKCNKLKYVFPVSICNEFPELKTLIVSEAKELEEIFKSSEGEGIEKVNIPNLELVVIVHLPSLFQTQQIQFKTITHRFIKDCDKLSLTSTKPDFWSVPYSFDFPEIGYNLYVRLRDLSKRLTPYKVEAPSKDELTSPQANTNIVIQASMNEQSVDQQCPIEETDATATPSQLDGSMSEKTVGTKNESPTQLVVPKQKGTEISVEEENTATNAKTTTSSTRLESELINEQSTTQQQSLGESHATIKPSQGNNGSTSEKIAAATLSTISGTKNESPIQKGLNYTSNLGHPFDYKQGIKISVEQGTTSTNSKAITSPGPTVISEHNRSSKAPTNEQSRLEETVADITPSELEGSTSEKAIGINNVSPIQLVTPKQKGIEIIVEESELINEQSTIQQQSLGESHATIKPSKGNNDIKIIVDGGTPSTNVKTLAASTSKHEKASHDIEISVEQGTTSTNSKATTSSSPIITSEHNSSLEEYGNGQTTQQSFSISTKEPLAMEVVDLGSSLETNQIKSLGDTSQVVEGLGSSLLVRRELEQLVSEKHLNYETLSLLTDFLVKYPSVLLNDASLTSRYKGYAYNCLAELLKFLQTHSVLDVLGSSHSEFVGLIQDVRKFSFNKDWLDGVEKRALFPDLQFSRDTMQKLLDSKKQVTKEVEQMRLKLYFINQHMEDIKHQLTSSEAVLASIIQQEEHVLETTAALSVPLGY